MLPKDQVALAMREAMSRPQLFRKPEQIKVRTSTPEEERKILDASLRALIGFYHFNALAVSRLVPEGGLVLDIASGSAAFLAFLATCRPDLQIIGVEESPALLELGQAHLAEVGVSGQVSLNEGTPTFFAERIPARIDMITSVLGLHTLSSANDLLRTLQEALLVRIRCGCALWIFDYARPNLAKTAEEFPVTLMPGTPVQFRWQIRNSLLAAFSYEEMMEAFDKVTFGKVFHAQSNNLNVFQAHWLEREDTMTTNSPGSWQEPKTTRFGVAQLKTLTTMFPKVPLPPHLK